MGWLFGKKKKVPKVPFPEGEKVDKNALQFSSPSSKERVIEPEEIKEAVGIEKPLAFPPPEDVQETEEPKTPEMPQLSAAPPMGKPFPMRDKGPDQRPMGADIGYNEPLFVKVDVYQEILARLDDLKADFSDLRHTNNVLQQSEFNEVNNFEKLRKSIKNIHDKLLQADKTLFKMEG